MQGPLRRTWSKAQSHAAGSGAKRASICVLHLLDLMGGQHMEIPSTWTQKGGGAKHPNEV